MGNSISCLFRRCFSIPAINTAPIHATPPAGASDTVYAYLTGWLLALIEIKYEGSSSNLLNEHPVMVMLFLVSKLVYVIALLVKFPSEHQTDRNDGDIHESLDLMVVVRHVSGFIACELLLLLLVTPIKCFIINASTLILLLLMFLCCKYLLKLLNHVPTQGPEIHNTEELSHVETRNRNNFVDFAPV